MLQLAVEIVMQRLRRNQRNAAVTARAQKQLRQKNAVANVNHKCRSKLPRPSTNAPKSAVPAWKENRKNANAKELPTQKPHLLRRQLPKLANKTKKLSLTTVLRFLLFLIGNQTKKRPTKCWPFCLALSDQDIEFSQNGAQFNLSTYGRVAHQLSIQTVRRSTRLNLRNSSF